MIYNFFISEPGAYAAILYGNKKELTASNHFTGFKCGDIARIRSGENSTLRKISYIEKVGVWIILSIGDLDLRVNDQDTWWTLTEELETEVTRVNL